MSRPVSLAFLATALVACRALAADAGAGPPRPRPARALNFRMLDSRGRSHELKRADAKVVVLFFTRNGCPIARQSVPKLRALAGKFAGSGAAFWMVNSASRDTPEAIAKEAAEFPTDPIPVLIDDTQGVARSLGVERTGEAVAIATGDRTIVYRGAIDDQHAEGAQKPAPAASYLEDALAEFLAGKPVSRPATDAAGCLLSFEADRLDVSYARQVAPLLRDKCVRCHRPGDIGPFALNGHEAVEDWADMIREVLIAKRMPPWHADPHVGTFSNDSSLTAEQARLLLRWIDQGCPRGEGADPLDVPPGPVPDWPLGPPDYVVPVPKQTIPATGVLNYRYVTSDFVMPEDAWVRTALFKPGNKKVVHHIIARELASLLPALTGKLPEQKEYFFTIWGPGTEVGVFPPGVGKFLPKGTRFHFELHYTTIGTEQTDESEMGLYLMKEPPKHTLRFRVAENRQIDIAPGDPDSRMSSSYTFPRDALLFGLGPHMHLRGSWFRFDLLYPDGRREALLNMPRYDFNWQTFYQFTEPKVVPAGAQLLCTGGFDNSARNPHNPDPTRRVRWGIQSFDEMFMGFLGVADLPARDTADADARGPRAEAPPARPSEAR